MEGRWMSRGLAALKGRWFGRRVAGGTFGWFGLWRSDGCQCGSSMRSLARSKTISDAWLHSVGAGDDPKGRRSMAIAMPWTMAMQAAAMRPA
eukprot:5067194-Ditylum_brightwellii.AAC.1